jgi:predicted protein tyrosine phosphatase
VCEKSHGGNVVTNILFVCGKNKWRSPTAEQMFAGYPGVVSASAGLSHDAEVPLSAELVEWADMIFVMEKVHKTKLSAQFRPQLSGQRVVVLGIPDNYKFMDEALVRLLEKKVTPYLPARHNAP